jgi:hypothetical protein
LTIVTDIVTWTKLAREGCTPDAILIARASAVPARGLANRSRADSG